MGTSFDDVIDLALVSIDDYTLMKLYQANETGFRNFCDGLLVRAIPNFFLCRQDLSYDMETRTFVSNLSPIEISILADFWCIEWFSRKINTASQFQAKLQNNGNFRNHSEAQNLKEKTSWADRLRERVYQKITDYQLMDLSSLFQE